MESILSENLMDIRKLPNGEEMANLNVHFTVNLE